MLDVLTVTTESIRQVCGVVKLKWIGICHMHPENFCGQWESM